MITLFDSIFSYLRTNCIIDKCCAKLNVSNELSDRMNGKRILAALRLNIENKCLLWIMANCERNVDYAANEMQFWNLRFFIFRNDKEYH